MRRNHWNIAKSNCIDRRILEFYNGPHPKTGSRNYRRNLRKWNQHNHNGGFYKSGLVRHHNGEWEFGYRSRRILLGSLELSSKYQLGRHFVDNCHRSLQSVAVYISTHPKHSQDSHLGQCLGQHKFDFHQNLHWFDATGGDHCCEANNDRQVEVFDLFGKLQGYFLFSHQIKLSSLTRGTTAETVHVDTGSGAATHAILARGIDVALPTVA